MQLNMAMLLGLVIVVLPSAHAHVAVRGGRSFLGTNMQPEVVAHTLRGVEDEWKAQAAVFAQCSLTANDGTSIVNCQDAPNSFSKSCRTVVGAIVQGSSGDKRVAKEYMVDVCGQKSIEGWHKQQCVELSHAVTAAMSADAYSNRNSFDSTKLCGSFWSTFLKEEQTRLAAEKAAREAAEKKAAEEEKIARELAEKKAQEEAAEEARKAEEKRKVEEQRRKVEEAARVKAEAEAKAKAAAENAAKKKAEAEAEAKAAKLKMEEAEKAEKEHKEAKAKLAAEKGKKQAAEKLEKQAGEKKSEKIAEQKAEQQVAEKKAEKKVAEKKAEKVAPAPKTAVAPVASEKSAAVAKPPAGKQAAPAASKKTA